MKQPLINSFTSFMLFLSSGIVWFFEILYLYKKTSVMGQFLDYLASVFTSQTSNKLTSKQKSSESHVTFAESSFSSAFGKNDSEKAAKLASITFSNRRTINIYQTIGFLAFLAHLLMFTIPMIKEESFDYSESHNWQQLTLTCIPPVVYIAAIGAMNRVHKPLSEGAKLSSKTLGLDLNSNHFVTSLKVIILITAICQIISIYSAKVLWLLVLIVPVWCYKLTSKIAQTEYERFAPTPKKQWVNKLNIAKSPKSKTPNKAPSTRKSNEAQANATPRTRTKRAVRNLITGVSDKYHAFEQNVAHQISQKIFTPLSPKLKMIEPDKN